MDGEFRVLDQALGDDDGVFVVRAGPAHERDAHVLAERELAAVGRRSVGEHIALLHLRRRPKRGALVERGKAVGAHEVDEADIHFLSLLSFLTMMCCASTCDDFACFFREDEAAGVARGARFDAGGDERRLGDEHGVACFCMFEPMSARFASSCSTNGIIEVAMENVCSVETSMSVDFVARRRESARRSTRTSTMSSAMLPSHQRRRRAVRDALLLFFERVEIDDFVGDLALLRL